jgi:hypothetical protein
MLKVYLRLQRKLKDKKRKVETHKVLIDSNSKMA